MLNSWPSPRLFIQQKQKHQTWFKHKNTRKTDKGEKRALGREREKKTWYLVIRTLLFSRKKNVPSGKKTCSGTFHISHHSAASCPQKTPMLWLRLKLKYISTHPVSRTSRLCRSHSVLPRSHILPPAIQTNSESPARREDYRRGHRSPNRRLWSPGRVADTRLKINQPRYI